MARLFVALWPSTEVIEQLRELDRPVIEGLRWTTEDQWHVTLQFLGEGSQDAMADKMAAARWTTRPLEMRLGPEVTMLGKEIVCLPASAPGLDKLARQVSEITGVRRTNRFKGHLTLARARNKAPKAALEALTGTPFEAEWIAETVALVRSALTPGGARYETVAESPL
ncbi:MAG TPA: RNA 2',3'-cyclic phosphodiesterase [Acidimicrobiales bacterium]|nr:RNA 2',3'-cyclic phosphodiesterase [Acidimicrobiales bacterium]